MTDFILGMLMVFLIGYGLWFVLDYRRYNPGNWVNLLKLLHPRAKASGRHSR